MGEMTKKISELGFGESITFSIRDLIKDQEEIEKLLNEEEEDDQDSA